MAKRLSIPPAERGKPKDRPIAGGECQTTPGKASAKDATKPKCPEGYTDEHPADHHEAHKRR